MYYAHRMNYFALLIVLLLFSSCSRKQEVTIAPQKTETQVLQVAMPGKDVFVQGHGQEIGLGVGAMSGIAGTPANGVAILHIFEDGFVSVTVNVNIAIPDEGTFYEAWITPPQGESPLSLGHLQNRFGDVRHSVTYENATDLDGATDVTVTLEQDDGDPSMGKDVVAKGTLKPVSRKGIAPVLKQP